MPKISVIVPVYNVEQYIEKCIESLLNQTYKDIEIILADDGSKDNSLKICQKYEKQDNRIKVFTQTNQGPSVARNNALKYATGEFIGFVDSDDYVCLNTYENALKYMTDDIDLVIWDVNVVSSDNLSYVSFFQERYFKLVSEGKTVPNNENLFKTAVVPWNKLYRNDIIKKHNVTFPEGRLYEDNAFWWKYTRWCRNFYFLNEKLSYYNMRTSSLRGEVIHKKNECEQDRVYMVENVYDYCVKNNIYRDEHKEYIEKLFFVSFVDAYDETSAKADITIQGYKLAKKMELFQSENPEVLKFANSVKAVYEYLEQSNINYDTSLITRNCGNLTENDISSVVMRIKENINFAKEKNNWKYESVAVAQKISDAFNLHEKLIKDYSKKLSMESEYEFLQDYATDFPYKINSTGDSEEPAEIILEFLSRLLKNQKADELIKFASIAFSLYPNNYEYIRMIGDAYMFVKRDIEKAYYYYVLYTNAIKDNPSVYSVLSSICAYKGDVMHQIMYKQKEFKAKQKLS